MKRFLSLIVQLAVLCIIFVVVLSVLSPFLPFIYQLLLLGFIILLIWALLSPFESLGWWAGWFGRPASQDTIAAALKQTERPEINHYIVYLSGIGAISGDFLYPEEIAFLDTVAARMPHVAIVKDVFPYAMNNNGLTGQRFFTWLWRWIKKLNLEGRKLLTNLINIRNLFQVAVSADRRYGPIYNYGTAEVIRDGLLRQGYHISSGIPVTLIGYSGGGQISLGAAAYLQPMLNAPLQIISMGGVMADDPGIERVDHLYHLYGTKDPVQKLGAIAYAGRWPLLTYSPWNQAKAEGKITMNAVGPITHNDPGGYFEAKEGGDVPNYQAHIVDVVTSLIEQQTKLPLPGQQASKNLE
jgi:hypothetical protein